MTEFKQKVTLFDIVLISLIAALCYVALMLVFVPFESMYIHFGNLIVVTAALLIGGWQGGLAGSVGMGLFDLLNGHAATFPATFILKFLIGFTTGLVFKRLSKKGRYPRILLLVAGGVAVLLAVLINIVFAAGIISILLTVLFGVLGLLFLGLSFLDRRFNAKTANAIFAAACGMGVNIVGEIIKRLISNMLLGSDPMAALTLAFMKQGSTLINAFFAIIGGVALFLPLEKPLGKLRDSYNQGKKITK
ncbi:MAG TPA: ECF transporter S component [Clostridiales bacterium]|nr:ECF transporter S component [Clostridiales bacterium]